MIKPILKIMLGLVLAVGVYNLIEDIQAAMCTFFVTMIYFMDPDAFNIKNLWNKEE